MISQGVFGQRSARPMSPAEKSRFLVNVKVRGLRTAPDRALVVSGEAALRHRRGHFQGLESVRTQGVLPETQHYVDNVMALRSRFGGP